MLNIRSAVSLLAFLAGTGVSWALLHEQPVLAVLDPLPDGFRLLTAADVSRIPEGDVSLPRHLRAARLAFDPTTMAGVIVEERPGATGRNMYRDSWTIRGDKHSVMRNELEPMPCPIVYGKSPVIAILGLEAGTPPIRVRLPSTGTEEPRARVQTAELLGGKLKATPRPLISPMYPIRYDLAFSGGKEGFLNFQIGVRPTQMVLPIAPGMRGITMLVKPGHRMPVASVKTWRGKLVKVRVNLGEMREPPFHPDVFFSHDRVKWNFELTALDGSFKHAGIVYKRDGIARLEFATQVAADPKAPYLTIVRLGDGWLGYALPAQCMYVPKPVETINIALPKLKDGQIIEVMAYTGGPGTTETWKHLFENAGKVVAAGNSQ